MRELSEQEQLARLVGRSGEDLEILDSASMLEQTLRGSLGNVSVEKLSQVRDEIEAHGDIIESKNKVKTKLVTSEKSFSTEQLMLELYNIRDELISAFEVSGMNTKASKKIETTINRAEKCIKLIGGEIEKFRPLNHLSGLTTPNFYKNAEKVIETTIQCYQLGEIKEAKIKEDGKSIHIIFTGTEGNTEYKADGIITADEWTGNEAIDYVYTPGEGYMTVKAYENGRWVIKSLENNEKYKVLWDLEEKSLSKKNLKIADKTDKIKEEVETVTQNNIENIESEIGDPIIKRE